MVLKRKQIIYVGLSGGVDSSVTAWLLKEAGYHVVGVFMKNWSSTADGCSIEDDLHDVVDVSDHLGIELKVINFEKEYQERVFNNFLSELRAGRTPNPDILCNSQIKFKVFLEYVIAEGADYLATGHYARLIRGPNSTVKLCQAIDHTKDQSYFLYRLEQSALQRIIFPLGYWYKKQIRTCAEQQGLCTAKKADSTGICFVGPQKFSLFLQNYFDNTPGNIVTVDGKIVGQHQGLMFYTIGQRQGLGIGGQSGSSVHEPWFVVDKSLERNELLVVQGSSNHFLWAQHVLITDVHWLESGCQYPCRLRGKNRYRQASEWCTVRVLSEKRLLVSYDKPQWAVAAGQSLVLYDRDVCIGGGVIVAAD